MVKKSFFRRRTSAEIQSLDCKVIEDPINLSKKIANLNPRTEGIIIDTSKIPLTNPHFTNLTDDLQYASRMALRGVKRTGQRTRSFPSYVFIQQPLSVSGAIEAYAKGRIPVKIRNQSMFETMSLIPEEENFYVGFRYRPITGNNLSPIMVPFWALGGGNHIDAYSQRVCKKLSFDSGTRVERKYAPEFIVRVPSTESEHKRYVVKWHHVPTRNRRDYDRAVIGWNTRPSYGEIKENEFDHREDLGPMHEFYALSHEGTHRHGESFEFTLIDPHATASWAELIRECMRSGDYSLLEMSQIPLLSRDDASYYNKCNNNVLIAERTGKDENSDYVLKHPRIDQLSVLMARRVGRELKRLKKGEVQSTMYWDPERDGRIANYPVLPGEE